MSMTSNISNKITEILSTTPQPIIWTAISLGLVTLVVASRSKLVLAMFGFGSIEFTSAKETVGLKRKDNSNGAGDSNSSGDSTLRQLAESVIPPVRLSPLLFNGHLQTMYVATGRGADADIYYKRKVFENDHKTYPGQYATDWVVPRPSAAMKRDKTLPPRTWHFTDEDWEAHCTGGNDDAATEMHKPLLIVLHGLSGGSHEQYVRQALGQITDAGQGGFAAVVVNSRGCCYSKITSSVLFNARSTWDLRQFVKWARQQWPKRRMFAMGFSLGANILCNYLGEEGDGCELEAAMLIGNPWNLDVSNALLRHTWIGTNVYLRVMADGLKRLTERHVEQICQNPNIDMDKVRSARFLYEWDRYVQCPSWGYPTESAYYRDASCVDASMNIKIPVLCLHAKDDPICNDLAVPYTQFGQTPYIVMCATSVGGHLGWFQLNGERWSNKAIYNFFTKFVKETDGARKPDIGLNGYAQPIDDDRPKPLYVATARHIHIPAV